jgi:hypothetical protein
MTTMAGWLKLNSLTNTTISKVNCSIDASDCLFSGLGKKGGGEVRCRC